MLAITRSISLLLLLLAASCGGDAREGGEGSTNRRRRETTRARPWWSPSPASGRRPTPPPRGGRRDDRRAVGAARTGGSRFGQPRAPGRDAGQHAPRIARVDADGVDAGKVVSAPHPLLSLGPVPEGPHQPPGSASIRRVKEPARDGAAPERFRPRGSGSRIQIWSGLQGHGAPLIGLRSSASAGFSGQRGAAISSQVSPPLRERCSLAPKCPCPTAA